MANELIVNDATDAVVKIHYEAWSLIHQIPPEGRHPAIAALIAAVVACDVALEVAAMEGDMPVDD